MGRTCEKIKHRILICSFSRRGGDGEGEGGGD